MSEISFDGKRVLVDGEKIKNVLDFTVRAQPGLTTATISVGVVASKVTVRAEPIINFNVTVPANVTDDELRVIIEDAVYSTLKRRINPK